MANAQAGLIDFTDMGPEQLTTIYVKNDLTLLDSADLRGWIAALASEQVLNKPRLAANANKLAKLLVSETGLGAETGNDLATLALEDLASFMSRADAYAIYNMLDGRALPNGDDCDVSGKTSATGTSASLEGAQSHAGAVSGACAISRVVEGYCKVDEGWHAIFGEGIEEKTVERNQVHSPNGWDIDQARPGCLQKEGTVGGHPGHGNSGNL